MTSRTSSKTVPDTPSPRVLDTRKARRRMTSQRTSETVSTDGHRSTQAFSRNLEHDIGP